MRRRTRRRLTKLLGWAAAAAVILGLVWLFCAVGDEISKYRGVNEKIKHLPCPPEPPKNSE